MQTHTHAPPGANPRPLAPLTRRDREVLDDEFLRLRALRDRIDATLWSMAKVLTDLDGVELPAIGPVGASLAELNKFGPQEPRRRRLANLVTAEDLAAYPVEYAMGVRGDCMSPEIPDGAYVHVDRSKPFARGDLVVIWKRPELVADGEPQAIIKRLIMGIPPWVTFPWKENPKSDVHALLMAEQINPRRQYAIKCDMLIAVHLCTGILPAERTRFKADAPRSFKRSRPVKTLRAVKGGREIV